MAGDRFEIRYKASVARDLRRVGRGTAETLLRRLDRTLGADPQAGKPLTGPFRGLRSLRIGDHRIVYSLGSDGLLVLRIAHRKEVYRGELPRH